MENVPNDVEENGHLYKAECDESDVELDENYSGEDAESGNCDNI